MKKRDAATRGRRDAEKNEKPARISRGLRGLTEQIQGDEEVLRRGGAESGHARQRKLGRLPVRERLARLLDPKSAFLELNLWAAWGMYREVGEVPAAGVFTGIGSVCGRRCMVVA